MMMIAKGIIRSFQKMREILCHLYDPVRMLRESDALAAKILRSL